MIKVCATGVDASMQMIAKAGDRLKTPPPLWKLKYL